MKEVVLIIMFIAFEVYQYKKHKKIEDIQANEIMMLSWLLSLAYNEIKPSKANERLRKEIEDLNILIVDSEIKE